MRSLFKKILGDPNDKAVKTLWPEVDEVNALETEFVAKSDEELKQTKEIYSARYRNGETLDDLLPEVFAAVREVARRNLHQRHFDVQILGGIVLHDGKIAEMKTGEGKTLTATSPVALNALAGKASTSSRSTTTSPNATRSGWAGSITRLD